MPHQDKVFVRGNHDQGSVRKMLPMIHLKGSRECFCRLRIFGIPWGSKLGFDLGPLPEDIDILISHEPPLGILDFASAGYRAECCGSKSLKTALDNLEKKALKRHAEHGHRVHVTPRAHLFGHIHEGRGLKRSNGTVFMNVANANPGRAKFVQSGAVVFDVASGGSRRIRVVEGNLESTPNL